MGRLFGVLLPYLNEGVCVMSFYCHGKYVSDEEFGENSVIRGIEKVSGEAVAIKRWQPRYPSRERRCR